MNSREDEHNIKYTRVQSTPTSIGLAGMLWGLVFNAAVW